MTKPWEETWTFDRYTTCFRVPDPDPLHRDRPVHASGMTYDPAMKGRMRLAAAAPALARALCLVEWSERLDDANHLYCPSCGAADAQGHAPKCRLNDALTAAGLMREDREAVRQSLHE